MSDPGQLLDAERPWPGLASYSEANRDFFKGRDRQAEELLRLVERETIVWLYGRSGLGKTSLLQAGLFPRLRPAGYLPASLRLALDEDSTSFQEQLAGALAREAAEHGVEAPSWDGSGSLWEYFYARDGELWSADDQLVTPVLVFDQFEEIFTLGRETPERRRRCEAFLTELGEVAENRRPDELRRKIEEDPALVARFDARRLPPKILLSFREDYLADFDDLHEFLRGRTSNRLRLLPLSGATSKEAILAASPVKLEPAVAERIVRFIDSRKKPLVQLEIEPALLSLVCQKFNEKRISNKEERIDANLITDGSAEVVLDEFYQGAFAGLDSRVRHFVEDRLLTASGHRDSCALDNALAAPGVDEPTLWKLTEKRLLRREDRDGQIRVELIHDRLAPVVKASRDSRREAEKRKAARRRQRRIAFALLFAIAVLTLFSLITLSQARETSRQASIVLVNNAQQALKDGQAERATRFAVLAAYESWVKVADPMAAPTLKAAAQASTLAMELRGHSTDINGVKVSPDGRTVLSWDSSGTLLVRDAETGRKVIDSQNHGLIWDAAFDETAWRVASHGSDGKAHIWNLSTSREIGVLQIDGETLRVQFDRRGKQALTWGESGVVQLWDVDSGKKIALAHHQAPVRGAIFDNTGMRVLSWDQEGWVRLWDGKSGSELATSKYDSGILGASFDSTDKWVLTWEGRVARVWEPMSDQQLGSFQTQSLIFGAAFDNSGSRVVSWEADGTSRVWDASTGVVSAKYKHEDAVWGARFTRYDNQVLSWGADGKAVLWDASTGLPVDASGHSSPILGALLDNGEKRLYSWDKSAIRIWSRSFVDLGASIDVAVAKENPRLLTRDYVGVRIWDSLMGSMLVAFQERGLKGATLDAAGKRCLTWSGEIARVWDISTGLEVSFVRHGGAVRQAGFDPKSEKIVSYTDSTVIIWDASAPRSQIQLEIPAIAGAAFDSSGSRILTWDKAGTAQIWQASTGQKVLDLAPEGGVLSATFDHQGKQVLTQEAHTIQVWDSATGARLGSARHQGPGVEANFAPADSRVISWTTTPPGSFWFKEKGHLRVWQSKSGAVEYFFPAAWVKHAEFDSKGQNLLLVGQGDLLTVRLPSQKMTEMPTNNVTLEGAGFDSKGDSIVGWGWQGANIWDAASGFDLATPTFQPVRSAELDSTETRLVVQLRGGRAQILDVRWALSNLSNRALIEAICQEKLRGPETPLAYSFSNRNGQVITMDSVRRISLGDAEFAPILRDRVGEDVCEAPTYFGLALDSIFNFR